MRNKRMHCKKGLAGIGAGSLIAALCLSACGAESTEAGATEEEEANLVGEVREAEDAQAAIELQRRVDAIVDANPGARQINENEVELEQGALVTVPLPGETIARGPGEPAVVPGVPNCPYYRSCWYEHANYEGYRLALYYCKFYNIGTIFMPDGRRWNDKISSWHNNQSGGAVANTYNWNGVNAWDYMFTAGVGYRAYVGSAWNDKIDGISNCP